MSRFTWAAVVLAAAVSCLGLEAALAGPIEPGQERWDYEDHRIYPMLPAALYQGALLAERTEPFWFDEVDDLGVAPSVEGTFTSRVYRDAGTGGLAFLYLLEETEDNGVTDLEGLIMNGFGTLPTDVYAERRSFVVRRSAGADQLDWSFDLSGSSARSSCVPPTGPTRCTLRAPSW